MKNKMGKTAKTFVVLSVVWMLIIYAVAADGYGFDEASFVVGIIPLVVGWGIYWIRRK
jgi:uncharacterized membrane protein|tara:strand:- start:596 stop:769 length:174 start_codon:yes stop_codon:yes gene_type:complete